MATNGADTIVGTLGDDIIDALGGRDTINATQGHDSVNGGTGSDRLNVIMGDASRFADPATASRTYTITNSYVGSSAGGLDTSFVSVERVTLDLGGTGDFGDTIDATAHSSSSLALDLRLGNGNDTVFGGAGNETIYARGGINWIDAGAGFDTVAADVDYASGTTVFVTGSGNQAQTVHNGIITNTILNAESISIGNNIELVFDVDGLTHTVDASAYTGSAQISFYDHNGDDVFIGSAGADFFGNLYNATIGDDIYTGNGGADIYDYTVAVNALNHDVITDFDTDDTIDFQYNDGASAPGQLLCNSFIGAAAFSGVAGQYRYAISGNQTLIQIDTDGDAAADRTLTIANGTFVIAETFTGSNVLRLAGQVITGTAGADILTGTLGDDIISSGGGLDTIHAGDGADVVVLSLPLSVSSTLDGGLGVDTLVLTSGLGATETQYGPISEYNLYNTTLSSFERLQFHSTAGNGVSALLFYGGFVPNQIGSGLSTTAELIGGDGFDILALVAFGPGSYTLPAGLTYTNWQTATNAWLPGTGDLVALVGAGDFNYTLTAANGNPSVQSLQSGGGNDTLIGSTGMDFLSAGGGSNTVSGGAGNDAVAIINTYVTGQAPSTLTGANSTYDGGADTDFLLIGGYVNFQGTLLNMEGIYLQPEFVTVASSDDNQAPAVLEISGNTLAALPSNLQIGGTGQIIANLSPGVGFNGSGYQFLAGSSVDVTIYGTSGNDAITGTSGADIITNGGGVDTIHAGDGDDTIVLNAQVGAGSVLDGGAGFDTLELKTQPGVPSILGGTITQYNGYFPSVPVSLEAVKYDSALGDVLSLVVVDQQRAASGLTTLIGGAGRDLFYDVVFQPGTYTMPLLTFSNWTSDLNDPSCDFVILFASSSGNYTLNAREGLGVLQALRGNSGNDVLNGSSGNDLLDGKGGINQLYGNDGDDLLYAENLRPFGGSASTLTFAGNIYNGGSGSDTLVIGGSVNFQGTLVSIEKIYFEPASPSPAPGVDGFDPARLTLSGSNALTLAGNANIGGTGTFVINLDAASSAIDISGWQFAGAAPINFFGNGDDKTIQIYGTGNDDLIRDADSGDVLWGNGGNDTIYGNGGDDAIRGGAGADTLYGGAGNDTIYGGFTRDIVQPQSGDLGDTIDGGAGNDRIRGGDGDDYIFGGADDDNLRGDAGNDTIDGGDGFDFVSYNFSNLTTSITFDLRAVTGGSNPQTVSDGQGGIDTLLNIEWTGIAGSQADDVLFGSATLVNELIGNGGNDQLVGGLADDYLDGGLGNDVLDGGAGNDAIYGGAGDDLIRGRLGDDLIDGGDGFDRAGYYHTDAAAGGVTVNLNIVGPQNTGSQGWDTLTSIEYVSGTPFADTLVGDANDNILWGYVATIDPDTNWVSTTNNDTLDGGGGNDLLYAGIGNHSLTGGSGIDTVGFTENWGDDPAIRISLALQGVAQDTGQGLWTLSGIENLSGGNDDDQLTGDDNANILAGSFGNDTLNGGGGNDSLYGDGVIDSGAPASGQPTLFPDVGAKGNDTLEGGDGDDILWGGGGVDELAGGAGLDQAGYAGNAADFAVVSLGGGAWQVSDLNAADGDEGVDLISGIEQLRFADQLVTLNEAPVATSASFQTDEDVDLGGQVAASDLENNSLTFQLVTGPTNGTLSFNPDGTFIYTPGADFFGADSFTFTASDGTTTSNLATANLTIAPVDNDPATIGGQLTAELTEGTNPAAPNGTVAGQLTATDPDGPTSFTAASQAGTWGAFTISAGGGWSYELADNDPFIGALKASDTVTDSFTVTTADGSSELVTITIHGANDAAVIAGTTSATVIEAALLGGASQVAGTLTISDIDSPAQFVAAALAGLYGTLTLTAGGSWTYVLNNANSVVDGLSNGNSLSDSFTVFAADGTAQLVTVTVSGSDDIRTGTSNADNLTGTTGNDTLNGNNGNDTLSGGLGNDVLNGGNGIDTATYAGLAAGVSVSLAISTPQNTGGGGIDTLLSIENLTGTSQADVLTGNASNNTLTGGDGNDALDGGAGDDILNGGNGSDTASYGSAGSAVTVSLAVSASQRTGGAGSDTLTAMENLVGSGFADTLTGSTGTNRIEGGAGNDRITGGGGGDQLFGGSGNDTFAFLALGDSLPASPDTIFDFAGGGVAGGDLIDLAAIDAIPGGRDNAFAFIGSAAFSGVSGQLRFDTAATPGFTLVQGDTNGDGVADFQIQLQWSDPASQIILNAQDFIL